MPFLRRQVAFDQANTATLNSSTQETHNDLDNFQPDAVFGRDINIVALQYSFRLSMTDIPVASELQLCVGEMQISTASTFGQEDNILAALYLEVGHVSGATTVGASGPEAAQANGWIGNFQVPLAQVRIPGAIYLHLQYFCTEATTALAAGQMHSGGQAVIYYRQL